MSLVRVHVHYSGRVQGVGFRYTVRSLVPGYDVLGTIRNLPDGRVELVAEGERAELEEFLGRKVHLFLQVKVRSNWLEEKERYSEMGLDFKDGS